MQITRIELRDVKRHAQLELALSPGLNIVRGPNEAGKSTIQRAIEIALFRRATSTAQELDGVRRWGAQADPTVVMDFIAEGISGRMTKIFAGQKGTVEVATDEGVERDPGAVEHIIASLTGLPSERFFIATASVHHHDLTDLKQDEGTLRDRLQQSMSGATRGTHAAKRKLEDAIRRYRSEGPKNPGYLKVARSEVERLTAEVAAGEEALERLEADRRIVAQTRLARDAIEANLESHQERLAASERAVALEKRAAEAQQRYVRYKRAAELHEEVEGLEASHPSSVPLDRLRAAVARLRDIEFRLSEIRAELESAPDPSSYPQPLPEPRWQRAATAAAVLAGAAALVGIGGFALGQAAVALAAGLLLGGAAVAAGWWASRARNHAIEVQFQNQLREEEVNRLMRGRSQRTDELGEKQREREEQLGALEQPNVAAAEAALAEESEHVAKIERLRAEYRGVLGGDEAAEDVLELRDRAAAEVDECRHALAGMGEIGAAPEKSLAANRAAIERLRGEREQALAAELQAEARLEANAVDAEQVAANIEALALATERLGQVERRLRIYTTTLEALQAAEEATMKKAARFLEQRMARDVARITDGRYRRLRVDETNLRFSVYSVERGEWVDAEALSQGTIDQLYLCARLGIVRLVTDPATPPLIFDDPFVTFDDDRARRAIELLRDTAAELQVIYLTCSDRYDDLADTVVELEGPDARDDEAAHGPAEADGFIDRPPHELEAPAA